MVTQLAVAGFMVSAAGKTLLIDALHRHPRHAPDPETLEKLENALPPFDNVDLILVSHSHTDHFHRESVAEHLIHNLEAVLVSGRVVHDELAELPSYERFRDRVIVVAPGPGQVVEIEANGIPMRVFRLSHGERNQDYSADNLGMMADLAGTKIFNTGDIVPHGQTEIFQEARMDRDGIDIAFLGFTMFDANFPEAATIIESYIKPRYIVPSHLYENHFGEFTDRIKDRYPNSIIFSSKGETRFIR
ncbi:MAG: MBL fold metallo-hydrolase [Gemmatimonadota bacterium]|nr:MAG: MBL fold metallo-hydrolase [Gemmatimonadota bacterium]